MKPHPRPPIIRKTIKWGGAAVTVLLVVVWIASGWWLMSYAFPRTNVIVGRGTIGVLRPGYGFPAHMRGWQVAQFTSRTFSGLDRWRGSWSEVHIGSDLVFLPLWWFIPIPLISWLVAWRLDALPRSAPHPPPCPRCGYDRTGLPLLAECPECGSGGVSKPFHQVFQSSGLNAVRLVLVVAAIIALWALARRWL